MMETSRPSLPFPLTVAGVSDFLPVSSEIYLYEHGLLLLFLDLSVLDTVY